MDFEYRPMTEVTGCGAPAPGRILKTTVTRCSPAMTDSLGCATHSEQVRTMDNVALGEWRPFERGAVKIFFGWRLMKSTGNQVASAAVSLL
jgi:hypothetical protein